MYYIFCLIAKAENDILTKVPCLEKSVALKYLFLTFESLPDNVFK